jgi:hypothetical protein
MKKLLFLSLFIFLFSCEKVETRKWKCTIVATEQRPGFPPVTNSFSEPHMFTDAEAIAFQRSHTTITPGIHFSECGDTLAIYKSTCNCDPMVCSQ